MQQHPKALDCLETAQARSAQQRCLQRHIHVVDHHQLVRRLRQVEIQGFMTDHTKRRGIHDQGVVRQRCDFILPINDS
jgi:hypothetical protein